jgi:hypothetical protein
MDLPDFSLPHAEKIEWMIETAGWAIESVPAQIDSDPPVPGYSYTIGFPSAFGFAEVLVFGLAPVAAKGVFELTAELLSGGTVIPLGVELTGLFDNGLRCVFAPVDLDEWSDLVATAVAWYRTAPFEVVQLLWPDRRGVLPTEPGFDPRVRNAQPVIGTMGSTE